MMGMGLASSFAAVSVLPTQTEGLVLWLRADMGVTIATGVSAWKDQSGTGDTNKNMSQGTAGSQPAYNATDAAYNNQPTLSFNGTSSNMSSGTWATPLAQPSTWIIVGQRNSHASNMFMTDSIEASHRQVLYFPTATTLTADTNGTDLVGGSVADSAPFVGAAIFNGASSSVYVNSSGSPTNGALGSNSMFGLTVGCNEATAGFLSGKIAEVIAYSGALTAAQLKNLFLYLGGRYGITTS